MVAWRFLLEQNIDPKVVTYLEREELSAEHVRDTLGQERMTKTMSSRTPASTTVSSPRVM